MNKDLIKAINKLGFHLYPAQYTLVWRKKEYRDEELWRVFAAALVDQVKGKKKL